MFSEETGWPVKSIVIQVLVVIFDFTLISLFYHFLSSKAWTWETFLGESGAMLCGAILVNLWWVFGKLRVVVDDNQLRVGLGPFRDTIELDQIIAWRPVSYSRLAWSGVHLWFKTRIYNVPTSSRLAVELRLRDGWRICFSSQDPVALCQALQACRPTSTSPGSKPGS